MARGWADAFVETVDDITDECLRDWPEDQSNRFGEYRTSEDSMRNARHGLLESPTALPQERLV